MPYTNPVVTSIVATPVLLLVHVPDGVASLSIVVLPAHTVAVPVIAATGFTETDVVTKQPPAMVYVIVAIPVPVPVITPFVAPIAA